MTAKRRRIPDRFFRMLLRLFPFDFRADHGKEMEQVFRAQRADAGGPGSLVRLWLETVQDVLVTAPLQHVHVLRQDVGYGVRILRRAPGFTIAAVVTLARCRMPSPIVSAGLPPRTDGGRRSGGIRAGDGLGERR